MHRTSVASSRPRLSFLERVDEASERGGLPVMITESLRTSRPEWVSDEELENVYHQPRAGAMRRPSATVSVKSVERRDLADPIERRLSALSRRSSSRPPLQQIGSHRTSAHHLVAATLNEKKQKKLVALFYWRRRTLETYLSVWKALVFDVSSGVGQRPQQPRELSLVRPYPPAPVRPVPDLDRYPRRGSVLLRNTLAQRRDSTRSAGYQSSGRDRMNALREEYRQLKASALQQQQVADPSSSHAQQQDEKHLTKRNAFKERLRVYYRCFAAWHEFVDDCKTERSRRQEQATSLHRKHQLRKHFHTWSSPFLVVCRSEKTQWRRACELNDRQTRRRRFRCWRRWLRWKLGENQKTDKLLRRRMTCHVSRWRKWTERTIRLQQLDPRRRRMVLCRYFRRLTNYRTQRRAKRRMVESAVVLDQRHSLRQALLEWYRAVFDNDNGERVQMLTRRIAQKAAVKRWKRYIARRRERLALVEQADCCLYEGILRRFWRQWMRFSSHQFDKKAVYDHATRHWVSNKRRRAVRALHTYRCTRNYERDRARGASEFYMFRRVRASFCAWQAYTCSMSQVRLFHDGRVRRCFLLCFVNWRQFGKKSRRLGELCNALQVHQRARVLQRSLRVWWYRHKLQTAFRLVDSRYVTRLMDRCLHAWWSITMQRQQWQQGIRYMVSKRHHRLVRHILASWRQAAVRSSCRRRLVRLFHKKQLYKRLHECVRVMHTHAKSQRFRRATETGRLEGAWHAWVTFRLDQQRRIESKLLAIQFYATRRYSLAIALWRENAQKWSRFRRQNTTAISHLVERMMQRALYAWYLKTRTMRRQRELVKTQTAIHTMSTLRRCLSQWKTAVRIFIHQRLGLCRLRRRAMERRANLAFFAWRLYIKHRNTHRHVVRDARRRYFRRRGRYILRAWRVIAFHRRRCGVVADEICSRRRKRILKQVLVVWRDVSSRLQRDRLNNWTAATFHREYLLLWAFFGWQHVALEGQVVREQQHQVEEARATKQLRRAVGIWKKKLANRHEQKNFMTRAAAFYRKRRHRRGVQAWRALMICRSKRRSKFTVAMAFASSKLVGRVFRAWLQFTTGTRYFKLKLRLVFQTGDDDIVRRAFRCWRRYKRSETLDKQADVWRTRSLLRIVWHYWHHQVAFGKKMRKNLLITNRLLQTNAARSAFTQWKKYVAIRHTAAHTVALGGEHFKLRCYRTAIRRLSIAVHQAQAIELSATFHGSHLQRQHFINWRRGVAMVKHRREMNTDIDRRVQRKRMQTAFSIWNRLVEIKRQLLQLKADCYVSSLVLKHTWRAWVRAVHLRHVADNAIIRHLRSHLLASFRQWIQFVREQQQIRRHVEAAVAHVDRVTLQKVWERWSEYICQQRERHRLNSVASSFYAMRVVQQGCFRGWATYVSYRHDRYVEQLKADSFRVMKTLHNYFVRLDAYVAHRHKREVAKQAEELVIRRLLMARAVAKWHRRAALIRSFTQAQAKASKFYKHRAEEKAICMLHEHRVMGQKKRRLWTQALTLRKQHLVCHFFARWTRFLTWRQRHRHLLRLFRSNQLTDYFVQWRKYVTRSRLKRALQATATQGYRTLVQRRAFQQWYARCRHWYKKHRASEWYRRRIRRSVLAVWAHRVHVLRKMRQMFRFQDAFRLETHFDTWRRFWWRKKQQIVRVQDAATWFKKHRQTKCFRLWVRWLETKRQAKKTYRMAIGFRTRFFSRKYLYSWRSVVGHKKRIRGLTAQAILRYQHNLQRTALTMLVAYAKIKKRLREAMREVKSTFLDVRSQRAINAWKCHVINRQDLRAMKISATKHHDRVVVGRHWSQLCRWHVVRRGKRKELQRAQTLHDRTSSRRALLGWLEYMRSQRRLRKGLRRFKEKYFRGVTEDCFYRWVLVVTTKRRLRTLKIRVVRSLERRVLRSWRDVAMAFRHQKAAITEINDRRWRRWLCRCFVHWESVATDRWIYSRIVQAARTKRDFAMAAHVFHRWKSLLPLRRAKKKWLAMARVRHRHLLVVAVQSWRSLIEIATGTDDDCRDGVN